VSVLDRSFLPTCTDSSIRQSSNHQATTPFEIGGNFKPDENSVLIAAVPDTKTGINQTLTVPNPDFVRSHRKYRDRYVVIVIINKY
jgi:hypothetical protein